MFRAKLIDLIDEFHDALQNMNLPEEWNNNVWLNPSKPYSDGGGYVFSKTSAKVEGYYEGPIGQSFTGLSLSQLTLEKDE